MTIALGVFRLLFIILTCLISVLASVAVVGEFSVQSLAWGTLAGCMLTSLAVGLEMALSKLSKDYLARLMVGLVGGCVLASCALFAFDRACVILNVPETLWLDYTRLSVMLVSIYACMAASARLGQEVAPEPDAPKEIVSTTTSRAGELLDVKIQRYGKEAKQGVGYLDDGTMVVVNGGGDFIGQIIATRILSQKNTSSGRMIFCNVANDRELVEV